MLKWDARRVLRPEHDINSNKWFSSSRFKSHSREIDENSRLVVVNQKLQFISMKSLLGRLYVRWRNWSPKTSQISKGSRREKRRKLPENISSFIVKEFFSSRPKAKLQNILSPSSRFHSWKSLSVEIVENVEQTWAIVVSFKLFQRDCVSYYYEISLTLLPRLPQQPQFFVVRVARKIKSAIEQA